MNSLKLIIGIAVCIFLLNCKGNSEDYDSQSSEKSDLTLEIKVGTQIWMRNNLDVEKFKNGDLIFEAKTNEEWINAINNGIPAWCYYDNNSANGNKYGKLYNWYAAIDSRGLAPIGWHLPSDKEWDFLINYLGGPKVAGKKIKSNFGWEENGNGTNSSKFSGLPSGHRDGSGLKTNGNFFGINTGTAWWSSEKSDSIYVLSYKDDELHKYPIQYFKKYGYPIRCVKD